jgi:hypothetical protein
MLEIHFIKSNDKRFHSMKNQVNSQSIENKSYDTR